MLEKLIKQFHYLTTVEWNNLYNEFEDVYKLMNQKFVKEYRYKMYSTETRIKILCFLYLCNGFRQQVEDYQWVGFPEKIFLYNEVFAETMDL